METVNQVAMIVVIACITYALGAIAHGIVKVLNAKAYLMRALAVRAFAEAGAPLEKLVHYRIKDPLPGRDLTDEKPATESARGNASGAGWGTVAIAGGGGSRTITPGTAGSDAAHGSGVSP